MLNDYGQLIEERSGRAACPESPRRLLKKGSRFEPVEGAFPRQLNQHELDEHESPTLADGVREPSEELQAF